MWKLLILLLIVTSCSISEAAFKENIYVIDTQFSIVANKSNTGSINDYKLDYKYTLYRNKNKTTSYTYHSKHNNMNEVKSYLLKNYNSSNKIPFYYD